MIKKFITKLNLLKQFKRILLVLLIVFFIACNSKKEDKDTFYFYVATNKKDSALLSIATSKLHFKGVYEVYYGSNVIKDSGDVTGKIHGDTLIGTYNYKTFGGSWKRKPIAFLKKEKKLVLGSGVDGGFMGFAYFNPDVPISFKDSKFVFNIKKDSLQKNIPK